MSTGKQVPIGEVTPELRDVLQFAADEAGVARGVLVEEILRRSKTTRDAARQLGLTIPPRTTRGRPKTDVLA